MFPQQELNNNNKLYRAHNRQCSMPKKEDARECAPNWEKTDYGTMEQLRIFLAHQKHIPKHGQDHVFSTYSTKLKSFVAFLIIFPHIQVITRACHIRLAPKVIHM